MFAKYRDALVRLDVNGCSGGATGTGFFGDDHHILTAAHVVEEASHIRARVAGRPISAKIVGMDRAQDLAVLKSDTRHTGPVIHLSEERPAEWNQLAVDGARLACRDRGDGEPVLLMHCGFIADGMVPLVEQPEFAGFRSVVFHRRGYGASSRADAAVSLGRQAEDVAALMDRLAVARAHLVGHSFGANVALELAAHLPDRLGALVLMEPLLGFALEPETAAYVGATAAQAMPLFAAGDHEGALDTWLTGAFGPGYRPALERFLPDAWPTAVADASTAFGGEVPSLQEWAFGMADLGRVGAPTLSVVSSATYWRGFGEIYEQLLSRIPGCEGATVPVPTHMLQIADPVAVAERVTDFLRRHPLS